MVEFAILTGSEFLIVAALQMGCHGCVGGLHNICPRIAVELYDAFRTGDLDTARQRQQSSIEAWQIFKHGAIWGAFDEALRWLGVCERATGDPYVTQLTADERAAVRAILENMSGLTQQHLWFLSERSAGVAAIHNYVLSSDIG